MQVEKTTCCRTYLDYKSIPLSSYLSDGWLNIGKNCMDNLVVYFTGDIYQFLH